MKFTECFRRYCSGGSRLQVSAMDIPTYAYDKLLLSPGIAGGLPTLFMCSTVSKANSRRTRLASAPVRAGQLAPPTRFH